MISQLLCSTACLEPRALPVGAEIKNEGVKNGDIGVSVKRGAGVGSYCRPTPFAPQESTNGTSSGSNE